jgi:hypothetical protein
MSKKIVVPCIFGGQVSPFEFLVGRPAEGSSPIAFQAKWLGDVKKGGVPPHILKALDDLYKISVETKTDFEDLCDYAFNKKDELPNNKE